MQKRRDFQFVAKDQLTDDNVFNNKGFVYGARARANVGYGFRQFAWGSKQTLNTADYQIARSGLSGMKGDHGCPLAFTDVALTGALTLGGNVTGGEQQTIADDAVGTFTPPSGFNGGWVRVTCHGETDWPREQASADLWCDFGSSLAIYKNSGWTTVGSDVDISTSDVTGTTGTDGRLTIAVQTGVMKIENRLDGSRSFQVRWG